MTFALDELPGLIAGARAILVDWDGCLALDGRILPGAADFLRDTAPRSFILSNNSTDLPEDFRIVLAGARVDVPQTRILLAGHQTIGYVARAYRGCRVHLVANARLTAHARAIGVDLVDTNAELVVLLRDTDFSYAALEAAANALKAGARLVVANPDRTHPGADGRIVPETGALLAALRGCVDLDPARIEIIGKPSRPLFDFALSRADVSPEEALMIGDNPLTDVAGAEQSGIRAILLEAGGATIADLAWAASLQSVDERVRRSWR